MKSNLQKEHPKSLECCLCNMQSELAEHFISVIEKRSGFSEKEQKRCIIMAFYATLPPPRPSEFEIEKMIVLEGWYKKPIEDMIKYYAPSTIANYKQMKIIPKDYSPSPKRSTSAKVCVF